MFRIGRIMHNFQLPGRDIAWRTRQVLKLHRE